MRKTTHGPAKRITVKRPKDLLAGAKAAAVKAGVKLKSTFVKSWSTSGDAD